MTLHCPPAGDVVTATVVKRLRAGPVTIPEGARLYGRLVVLRIDVQDRCVTAVIEFSRIEFGGTRYELTAGLKSFDPLEGLRLHRPVRTAAEALLRNMQIRNRRPPVGPAAFEMRDGLLQLPAGFGMEWITVDTGELSPQIQ